MELYEHKDFTWQTTSNEEKAESEGMHRNPLFNGSEIDDVLRREEATEDKKEDCILRSGFE